MNPEDFALQRGGMGGGKPGKASMEKDVLTGTSRNQEVED